MTLNMGKSIAAGLIVALIGISGCADNPITPAGENAESGRSESGEEHGDNAGGEGHESSEGGAGRLVADEEGGQQLAPDQRYDQTRSGARLIIWYVPSRNAFYGTVENTTNQVLRRVRVEVHLSDGANAIAAELGPTTPTDLSPGARLFINLSAAGQTFDGWSPHVEVGSGEGGEHGGEGGGESGESGGEGSETGGHAEGGEGGESDPSSPILALDESWDGVVNGLRVAMSYDPGRRSFSGIVENAMAQTACSVQIELNLKQGTRTVVELGPSPVGDLAPGASATTELLVEDEPLAAGVAFDAWEIHPELFDCARNGPSPTSGERGEGGEEGGQQLAPDQRYDQTRSGARLIIWYVPSRNAFYGTVENTTNQVLRRVWVEVHLSDGANAIAAELGPTTPTDLSPGARLFINLSAADQTFDGWSPHVEVGSGEGGEGGEHGGEGSEGGGEGSETGGHAEGGREGGEHGGEGSERGGEGGEGSG